MGQTGTSLLSEVERPLRRKNGIKCYNLDIADTSLTFKTTFRYKKQNHVMEAFKKTKYKIHGQSTHKELRQKEVCRLKTSDEKMDLAGAVGEDMHATVGRPHADLN